MTNKQGVLKTLDRWINTGTNEAATENYACFGCLPNLHGSTSYAVEWLRRARDLVTEIEDSSQSPDAIPQFTVEKIGKFERGMSMRQWYKGQALQGYLAAGNKVEPVHIGRGTSTMCGLFADAMIAEDEEHAKGAANV